MTMPTVVLPGLRVAHAQEKFKRAVKESDDPNEWFNVVIEALEEGAARWGNACPECGMLIPRDQQWGGPVSTCLAGHDLSKGSSLLIAWEPVR